MFRDYRLFLFDILLSIKKIKIYTQKFENAIDFKYSMMEWDATIREFEIIGEAANYLNLLTVLFCFISSVKIVMILSLWLWGI